MIAGGNAHSLALKADGTIICWGANYYGQPNVPVGLSNVRAIAAGHDHSLALKADGTVVAWGQNFFGQTNVPIGLSNVVAIAAAGGDHSLALRADGTVIAWGDNDFGQTNVPAGLSNVLAVAAGHNHSLALKADGTVIAWGTDTFGETAVPANLSNVTAIAAGEASSLALLGDGTVVAWGYNSFGETIVPVGLSGVKAIAAGWFHNLALVSDGPIQIIQAPESQSLSYTSNTTFSVVATGRELMGYRWFRDGQPLTDSPRVFGVTNATLNIYNAQFSDIGTYTVIVSNAFGSVISSGATCTVISPPFIIQQPENQTMAAGSDVTLPAAASGTPPLRFQWNFNGTDIPHATNTTLTFTNVQPAASGLYYLRVTNLYGTTQTIRASLTVTDSPPYILIQPASQMLPLGGSTVLTVSARGSTPLFYQWRFNGNDVPGATNATLALANLRYDQAGFYNVAISNALGGVLSTKAFVNVSQVLTWGNPFNGNTNAPSGLTNVIAVAGGDAHITALKADGTVRTWLANAQYVFGASTGITNVPTSATNVIAIAAGRNHSLALRSNGTVVAWGGNQNGQINVPTGLSNVMAVAAGSFRSYAVRVDGTVVGWGSQAIVPVGLSNVVAMASGYSHNLALKQDGTVTAWGSPAIPVNVPFGLSNVIAIDAGDSHYLALKQDGTVVTWGQNVAGSPRGLSDVVTIAAGASGSMALKQDGTVVRWGYWGQLPPPAPAWSNVVAIAAGGVQPGFAVALIGNGSPAFALQPASQSTTNGATVRLHARTAGVQPMSYQWQLNGANLPDATNVSLTITNLQGKATGGYRMIAANALGSAVSATALVTIHFSTNLSAALNYTPRGPWTTGLTNTAWFAQIRETHDGDVAAQSGPITHNQSSPLQTGFLSGPGTLTFWWKVSSEEGFDFLRLYLDQSTIPLASISGETAWQQQSIHITTSRQVLKWVYAKDGNVSAGRDAGWLDEVVFTPDPPTITRQPQPNLTVPAGASASYKLEVSGLGPISYQWFKDGNSMLGATQTFLNLPSVNRRSSGTYRAQASNAGGSVMSSNAVLKVIVQQRMGSIHMTSDGSLEITSQDADGGALSALDLPAFEAQLSTNLVHWQVLPDSLIITNGALLLRDLGALLWPQRFYRIVEH